MDPRLTRQIQIVHLTDMHFGNNHRFNPIKGAETGMESGRGITSMSEKFAQDLKDVPKNGPVAVCLTGDFATTASPAEFKEAKLFVESLVDLDVAGQRLKNTDLFAVAGNHDVVFDQADMSQRLLQWKEFSHTTFENHRSADSELGVELHDRTDDLGTIFLCLNSSKYVQKGKRDEDRGHIDEEQINVARTKLKAIDKERRESAIRVALIHHHPLLVPNLIDPGRGYDAIHNGGLLLRLLHQFGFHLILHGHKHLPLTLIDDQRQAFTYELDHSLLVVAGGSIGSTELVNTPTSTNSYNLITVKWHPHAGACRIHTETRGLKRFDECMVEQTPSQWEWTTLRVDDRTLTSSEVRPNCQAGSIEIIPTSSVAAGEDDCRKAEYARLRGNYPVVEVRPSVQNGQAYEATLWIVQHRPGAEVPVKVVWSAGNNFNRLQANSTDAPHFCATYDYWDSMLVESTLHFKDGRTEKAYVYARLPAARTAAFGGKQ